MTPASPRSREPDAAWFAETVSCRAACPVDTDAAGYVQAIADGRIADAYDLARAHNPFPSVCGRVCSAPCEKACRRGVIDAPVAIRALKRVACEAFGVERGTEARWHLAHGPVVPVSRASIGIVGAGPAGLAAAYALRLAGHAVTLYDSSAEAGGMLLWGIPAFRLPRELIRQEIASILSLGVEFIGNVTVGVDRSWRQIRAQHAAVLVTVGCAKGRSLPTPGATLPGIISAIEFLNEFNRGALQTIATPVVVIGGGSVAFDAARSAQRLQSPRGPSALASHTDPTEALVPAVQLIAPEAFDALPVPVEELHEAAIEGVVIRAAMGAREFDGAGVVQRVVIAPIASLHDERGRFRPTLQDGRDETVPAQTVILAVGQRSDVEFVDERERAVTAWGGLESPTRDGRTAHAAIYTAGDVSTGPGDLIDAIASGQRAAASILADFARVETVSNATHAATGEVLHVEPLSMERRYWSGYDAIARRVLPVLPAIARAAETEVEGALSLKDARREASRCLLCDTHIVLEASRCIACALCVDVCPYGCIALAVERPASDVDSGLAGRFELTLDEASCIRCGLCVDRCPPHALDLVRA